MSNENADTGAAGASAPNESDTVTHVAFPDPAGGATARAVLTPNQDTRSKVVHADLRPPIPLIFLPGVMGTLLVNKNTGGTVWDPPNTDHVSSYGSGLSILTGWFAGASSRQKRFDPTQAIVNPNGPVDVSGGDVTEQEARRRGWGALHRTSYSQVLAWLDHQLNNPMFHGKSVGVWQSGDPEGQHFTFRSLLGTAPANYGASGSGGALSSESDEFRHFARYRFPVYAIGYNWLQSNLDSGRDVLNGIDFVDPKTRKVTRIKGIKEICAENKTDKAIIVTHSLGGIVARVASEVLGGAGSIYGIVHGVQPATGAPLAAKRFRTGGEGFINQSLMGGDDAEFVAVTANARGPLELVPMPDYHNGAPWWTVKDLDGNALMSLPKKSALTEIYLNSSWYGLLPDPKVLDPAGIVTKRLKQAGGRTTVLGNFRTTMTDVVKLQNQLVSKYHTNTYAFYGNGALKPKSQPTGSGQTSDQKMEPSADDYHLLTWGNVYWTGDIPSGVSEQELKAAPMVSDYHNGEVQIILRGKWVSVTVQQEAYIPPSGKDVGIIPGDGTVPIWSSEAQARGVKPDVAGPAAEGVKMAFTQGGFSHQFCYSHPWARWATLYSIVKIAQSIEVPAQ
ncbi:MAG: alpha/beta hydrolase [Paraburkholderia sp.]|jgi:hypothetical protein|uniref:esterase/lipase family protein n=1 Tax=Paraburkholderia sp. TaxID=1926495 RepID=UPI00397BAE48